MLKQRVRELAQENAKLKKEMNHEFVRQKDNVARMYLEFFKKQQLAFEKAKEYPEIAYDASLHDKTDREIFLSAETMFHCYYSYLRGKEIHDKEPADSDEEYRDEGGNFFQDKVVCEPEVKNKQLVLHYFKFF